MSKKPSLIKRFACSYIQATNNCFGTFWKGILALIFVGLFTILIALTIDLMAEVAYIVYPHTILIQQIFYTALTLIYIILVFEMISIVFGLFGSGYYKKLEAYKKCGFT
ncbi:MAG: hypothetical protein QXS81_04755 [Candidatus Micrarchaeaceae archaeon]